MTLGDQAAHYKEFLALIPEDINQISAFAKEEIQNKLADDIKTCYTTNYDNAWAAIDTRD